VITTGSAASTNAEPNLAGRTSWSIYRFEFQQFDPVGTDVKERAPAGLILPNRTPISPGHLGVAQWRREMGTVQFRSF